MVEKEHILIVDDVAENITIMVESLHDAYTLSAAIDGPTAIERALESPRPDLILLDVMMPGMDGYAVCRELKANPLTRDIPIIFVTALDDPAEEIRGLEIGAVDYITKPISPPVVKARVRTHLQLQEARRLLQRQNEELEREVAERTADVIKAQRERVDSLKVFSSAVAHQVRNPVMAIGGMAGLLVKKAPHGSKLVGYGDSIREECKRLESLVRAISDYVSTSASAVAPTPVGTIVDNAIAMAEERASGTEYSLETVIELEDAELSAEEGLMTVALAEIVFNAIEFSDGAAVRLSIKGDISCGEDIGIADCLLPANRHYTLSLADNGTGIARNDLPYVFDPFFTTKPKGIGMGLTKVKRIVCEEHHGSISIASPQANLETGTMVTLGLLLA